MNREKIEKENYKKLLKKGAKWYRIYARHSQGLQSQRKEVLSLVAPTNATCKYSIESISFGKDIFYKSDFDGHYEDEPISNNAYWCFCTIPNDTEVIEIDFNKKVEDVMEIINMTTDVLKMGRCYNSHCGGTLDR